MNRPAFRVFDTGLRSGRENIAFDQAMIDARQAGEIPDSLRFISFRPSALVGRHQAVGQEVRLAYCRETGIEVGRRITGGGAIFLDEGQLGWALVCNRASIGGGQLSEITRKVCEAAASGLRRLGIDARFRPRNDIEVDGRKISGTGGFFDGDTLIYQGTVIGEMRADIMFSALNVPAPKVAKHDRGAAHARVTSLRELTLAAPDWRAVKNALAAGFSEGLGIDLIAGESSKSEEQRARDLFANEIGTDDFVFEIDDPAREPGVLTGAHQGAGGAIMAHLRVEGPANDRIREILITGDFFVTPPRVILDLEAHLRGAPLSDVESRIEKFFSRTEVGLLSVSPADFATAIRSAG